MATEQDSRPDNRLAVIRPALRGHVDRVRVAVGRIGSAGLDAGRALAALKAECRHGEWLPALAAAGMAERTAQRLMRYAREVEARGLTAAPPAVTALLTAASTPAPTPAKPDTVSDLDTIEPLPIDGEPLPTDLQNIAPIIEELLRFGTLYGILFGLPRGTRARWTARHMFNESNKAMRARAAALNPPQPFDIKDFPWDRGGRVLSYRPSAVPDRLADMYTGDWTEADEYPLIARHFPGALTDRFRELMDARFNDAGGES